MSTSERAARSSSPATRPFLVALGTASLAAAIWTSLMVEAFDRNAAWNDVLLFAIYLAAYTVSFLLLIWIATSIPPLLYRGVRHRGRAAVLQRLVATATPLAVAAGALVWLISPNPWLSLGGGLAALVVLTLVLARLAPGVARIVAPGWLGAVAACAAPMALLVFAFSRAVLPGLGTDSDPILVEGRAPGAQHPRGVKLIAIDGVDLQKIEQFIQMGRLPNFRRVIEQGVSAPLTTVSPHSPIVWTSVATGAPPEEHRVNAYTTDFVRGTRLTAPEHDLDVLGRVVDTAVGYRESAAVSSNERRCKSIWELLTQLGRKSLVLNWWATYPAEPIEGIMVSNRAIPWSGFSKADFDELDGLSNLVWPEDRRRDVKEFARNVVRERGGEDMERNAFSFEGSRYFALRDDVLLGLFRQLYNPTYAFATLYMQDVDTSSHAFSQHVFGPNVNLKRAPRFSQQETVDLWNEVVGRAYERMDQRIGILLEDLAEGECMLFVSDHGWRYDGTSHWQLPQGVFLGYGAPVAAGKRLDSAHVYDILPTVAFLLGVPLSRELPGQVLLEALEGPIVNADALYVDGYGSRTQRIVVDVQGSDEKHLERLRSLGYIN